MTENFNFEFLEDKPLADVTVAELQTLISDLFKRRGALEEEEKILTQKRKELDSLKFRIQNILIALDRTDFNAPGVGAVTISKRFTFKWPQDYESVKLAQTWLLDHGYGDRLKMHAAEFTSTCKELAKDFIENDLPIPENIIPGVGAPEFVEILNMRTTKNHLG